MILSRYYRAILCLALPALVWRPAPGWAWGNEGHRIIALVADRLLQTGDPPVQRKLGEILATDTSNDWTKRDVADEATWADAINFYKLDIAYRDRAIAAVKQQLTKAGVRLAALLSENLK
jgi:hypothetical protein